MHIRSLDVFGRYLVVWRHLFRYRKCHWHILPRSHSLKQYTHLEVRALLNRVNREKGFVF